MPTPILCPVPRQRWFDVNGNPLAGGKLYTYLSNSSTPKATYTDATGGNLNTNPIVLDSTGQADVWLSGDYKLVLTDAAGVQQWEVDGIDSSSGDDALETKFISTLVSMAGPISDRPTPDASLGQANHGMLYFSLDEHKAYRWNGTTWIDVTTGLFPAVPSRKVALVYVVDGGGVVPSTGDKGVVSVPCDCTITGWNLTSDVVGSAQVDVYLSTYAAYPTMANITGADRPLIAAGRKGQNLAISTWSTTAIPAGSYLQFRLDSIATCTRLTLTLFMTIAG